MIDRDETRRILDTADLVEIIGKRITLKKKGPEHLGLCPFHNDKTPSLSVNRAKGIWKCFGCGEGGDAADFIMKYDHVNFPEAIKSIQGGLVSGSIPSRADIPKPPPPAPQVSPVPLDAPPANFVHSRYGQPATVWTYNDAQGRILGHVCRYEPVGERKQVLPLTYRLGEGWRFRGFDNPRPLYGLDFLAASPDKTVLIVEGEKTAEFIQRHIPTAAVVTWNGGTDNVKNADFSPLFGRRNILVWADNDLTHTYGKGHSKAGQIKPWHEQPGKKAMLEIIEIIRPHVGNIEWVESPADKPCGWDAADDEWAPGALRNYVLAHRSPVPVVDPLPADNEPEQAETRPKRDDSQPFTFLGFRKDGDLPKFCFYAGTSKTVISMGASGINKQSILNLAPISWWETHYAGSKGLNMDAITNFLTSYSFAAGIFSESRLRGRGAWMDEGRTVLHSGDSLIVDGEEMPLGALQTKYIYEQGFPLGLKITEPVELMESSRLIDMLSLINWERPVNAYLLAGWCVIAPVCGALKWRPHIWLTGAAGTGKSWVFKNIVRRLLGESGLAVQGKTTEPGIRALLASDALPVVFDESEGEDPAAQARIQSILDLMRASSADDGGVLAQGSAGGGRGVTYRIRTCFAFASIGIQVKQQSDRSRVTVLGIRRRVGDDRRIVWEQLQAMYANLITDDFIAALHSRTISMLPTILKNAEMFNRACAAVLGEQRHGDQLGAMIAGAYSLKFDRLVDYDAAKKWVEAMDWTEERSLDESRDENRLLNRILEHIVEVENDYTKVKRTIGELCIIGIGRDVDSHVPGDQAVKVLARVGIKFRDGMLLISNSSQGIKNILERTPWSGENHNKILVRIDGAKPTEPTNFGPVKHRAVAIPLTILLS